MATKLDKWFVERETLLAEVVEGLETLRKKCDVVHAERESLKWSSNPSDYDKLHRLDAIDNLFMPSVTIYNVAESLDDALKVTSNAQKILNGRHRIVDELLQSTELEAA